MRYPAAQWGVVIHVVSLIVCLQDSKRHLLAEVAKEGGNRAHELMEVRARKTLQARAGRSPHQLRPRQFRKCLDISNDLAPGQTGGVRARPNHLNFAAIDDE